MDDERQAAIATKAVGACSVEMPGWISAIVLCETVWVLSRAYGYEKETIQAVLQRIFLASELVVEQQEKGWKEAGLSSGCRVASYQDA